MTCYLHHCHCRLSCGASFDSTSFLLPRTIVLWTGPCRVLWPHSRLQFHAIWRDFVIFYFFLSFTILSSSLSLRHSTSFRHQPQPSKSSYMRQCLHTNTESRVSKSREKRYFQ
ncbi:uncharacterized protein B0I36DRAFT_9678 [Microdochium trichocladiopsis]|uniref:Uncharacterized protein n=1 Tax=Microdochium trichocladiopsis TaxID=1682393 RepID=A0A9P8YI17_9PEZI|nr:uncharacterized protein B0I36DRAFT_9678 [Microdochium trichocladiopsis]KAH7040388.1 hypothetical protein B0I36DRAFT_9678 [Microdochium trichocladiopsis]